MTDPYCQHPECHSRYTAQYVDGYTTTANVAGHPPQTYKIIYPPGQPVAGCRRWCKAHALIFERCAWG